MPDSRPCSGLRTAQVRGDLINAREAQGFKTLQLSLAELSLGEPFRFKAVVYRNDHAQNRNGWAIRPAGMAAFARSARNKPLLLNHDIDQVVGTIVSSKAVKSDESLTHPDMIVQELEVRSERGKERLAVGGIPEFSVRLQRDENTKVACSVCGEDKLDMSSECVHWRGVRYDGQVAGDIYSVGTHAESSIVVGPAIPGTGPLSQDADEDDIFRAHQLRVSRLVSAQSQDEPTMDDENTPGKDADEAGHVDEQEADVDEQDAGGAADDTDESDADDTDDTDESDTDDADESDADADDGDGDDEDDVVAAAAAGVEAVEAVEAAEAAQVARALHAGLRQQLEQSADRQRAIEAELATEREQNAGLKETNAGLKDHLERIRGEKVAEDSLRIVRALRLEGRAQGNEDALVEERIHDPEHFDRIFEFVKPNPAFSSIQVARASATEPQNTDVLSAAMLAHQARLRGTEMAKSTGRPIKDCVEESWATLRNRQHAASQEASRKSRHS